MKGTFSSGSASFLLSMSVAIPLVVSCATVPRGGRAPAGDAPTHHASAPDWYAEPLSWAKLQRIESWLASSAPSRWPDSIAQAELELAKGRVSLARREQATLSRPSLAARLSLAEAGFRRVLSDDRADPFHRSQAHTGLADIEQLRHGNAGNASYDPAGLPTIRSRAAWNARRPIAARIHRNTRPWTKITVHHSATSTAGLSSDTESASASAIRLIQKNHMETQGWGDIGYHFLIDPAGRVFQGRHIGYQGAHAGGTNNVANIGICLLGDFETSRPDPRATRSLEQLVRALADRHGISRASVKGHKAFKATDCPGRNLMAWVDRYASGRGL